MNPHLIKIAVGYIDILLLLPLIYGAYKGFSKGLVIEIATLAGLILGVFLAIRFSGYMAGFLKDFLEIPDRYLYYIAFSVTLLLVIVVLYLLGKLLTKLVDIMSLGLVNKLLGTVLGIAKYFVILCIVLVFVGELNRIYPFISPETMEKNHLFCYFFNFAEQMYHTMRA